MPRRLGSICAQVVPTNRLIAIVGSGLAEPVLPDFTTDKLCYPGPDMVYLRSASARWHEVDVTVEAWDSAPRSPHSDMHRPRTDNRRTASSGCGYGYGRCEPPTPAPAFCARVPLALLDLDLDRPTVA